MWHSDLVNGLLAGGCLWVAEKPFALPNKEMGYLWDRGNPQPFKKLLIMDTTKGNSINAPGSSLLNTECDSDKKSWAERVEESSSTPESNNAVTCDDDGTRFFVIKRTEGDFSKTSPFLIQKSIQSVVGEINSIKKMRSGELLIEVQNKTQAQNIKKCTHLANIPVIVSAHRTLNSCRGVISESDLQYVSEAEILENLKDQKVTEVKRISIFRNNERIPTKHLILTFASTRIPPSLKAGYLHCSIRPYIPNPLRCFNCQRFGHSKTSCRGNTTCGRCAAVGHESLDCKEPVRCVNCKNEHPSYSKSCQKWKTEKEIQTIRTKQNITYPEARKIVESRTPTVGISYAAAAAQKLNQKTYRTIETQTESPAEKILESKITKENQNQTPRKPDQTSKAPQSSNSKLPLHKRIKQNTTTTQTVKQNRKSNLGKNLPTIKSSVAIANPPTKKKKETPTTEIIKNGKSLQDETFLSLHPSDNEDDGMSINSNEGSPDTFI